MAATRPLSIAMWCLALAPAAGAAQSDSAAALATRSVRDGVYTAAQAVRGEARFQEACAECHVPGQFAGATFVRSWSGRSAYDLFSLIRTTMPFDNPGRLSREAYAEVLAYVFRLNGFPAGERELPSDDGGLRLVRLEPPPEE